MEEITLFGASVWLVIACFVAAVCVGALWMHTSRLWMHAGRFGHGKWIVVQRVICAMLCFLAIYNIVTQLGLAVGTPPELLLIRADRAADHHWVALLDCVLALVFYQLLVRSARRETRLGR